MNSEQSQHEDKILAMRIKDERCETSFNRLFEKHKGLVHWICYERLFNHEDAQDATQEAFSVFWQKIDQWNGGNVKTYLYAIAKHAAIRLRTHNSREKRGGGVEMIHIDAIGSDSNPYQLADPRAEYQANERECEFEIDRALLMMKPKWRLAWILKYREGYTLKAIGEMLGGRSRQAAQLWVSKANAYLRQVLWAFYEDLITE